MSSSEIWIPGTGDLSLFSPELALVGTIVAVLIVPLVAGRGSRLAAAVALVGVLITLLLAAHVARTDLLEQGSQGGFSPPGATPMLLIDSFAIFFKFFLMLFLALIIGLWLHGLSFAESEGRFPTQPSAPEFFVLLLTSALGMALMVASLNLLVIIIAVEMASLPSYAIVASDKRSRRGAEASLKYVMFGAGTAAVMTYGASLLYGAFGTIDIPTMAARIAADPAGLSLVSWFGLFALCVGIAFKISAVPFHFWCPDVFEGAPIEVTTWLSVASKAAGLGLLLRVVHAFNDVWSTSDRMAPFAWGIGVFAAITCTVGNLAALRQESVKRILAYSSIAHAGYMMMAAAIFVRPAAPGSVNIGLAALIAYLFVYLIMNFGAFAVTAMVFWKTGSEHLSAFNGLGRRAPWLAIPMAVCLFSLVGLPPLGGFAAKWWLLYALGRAAMSDESQLWLWGLVIVAVVNTAISLYYYVLIIKTMYLDDDEKQPRLDAPISGLAMVNICAVALILLGTIFFNPLGKRAERFASKLFNPRVVQARRLVADDPVREDGSAVGDPLVAGIWESSDRSSVDQVHPVTP